MKEEEFKELLKTLYLIQSTDPDNFVVSRFVNYPELTEDQRIKINKEFAQKAGIASYNYFENDYF